jgi:hypothetical protein
MVKASDMTPDAQAAHYAAVERAIVGVDATNERLDERAERRRQDGSEFAERADARQRAQQERAAAAVQVAPSPQPPPPARDRKAETMDPEASRAWNQWADRKVEAALSKFAEGMVEATMDHLQERFTRSRQLTNEAIGALTDKVTADGVAVIEMLTTLEHQVGALQARLETVEARTTVKPDPPRLVGFQGGRHVG